MYDQRCLVVRALERVMPSIRRWFVAWISAAAVLGDGALLRAGEPYAPKDDGDVLETLPVSLFNNRDEVAELRTRLAQSPTNPSVASAVAARYMQLGSQSGDPRFYGYARATLETWWESPDPPADILKLRAKLKEKNHDYDASLADLHLLLERDPQDIQGWIEVANINRVQGRYGQSRQACDRLREFGPFAEALGRIPLMAVTGQAAEAYRQLAELLPEARSQYPMTVQWFLTMQAEVGLALGRHEQAEAHLREALTLAPEDKYLLRAYGELLLDQGRNAEALELVDGHPTDDGLLLCAALAAKRLGRETHSAELQAQLESRFDEIRRRGDLPLGRFEARFMLAIKNEPREALALALANWRLQKEPHDTQTVLEAALAANQPEQARPVIEFLAASHTKHAALQSLVALLEQAR